MLGDASDFSPLDLLGSLAVNAVTTNLACKSDTFRVGWKNKTTGDIAPWMDYRFLGGVAAAAVGQFGGPMVRRAGHDAAVGLLGSYVATETCRAAAIERMKTGGQALSYSAPAPAAAAPPAPAGGPNYAYGW
ncbi:hypothetical protein CMI47_09505 [Candidatus Pacearchaeota archaeon]|nr:hypothetical protein [Candidatus Pacearchaeota archaeon]|tara:strand:- start:17532 stop:17927 length:396 start_codon:yes stop_codon:yes gene_type:complete